MKTQNIEHDNSNINVNCPNCEEWESMGIDDPRHHLSHITIVEWKPDEEDKVEESIMECGGCKEKFLMTWDYEKGLIKNDN